MANPKPRTEFLQPAPPWKKGQSGNPAGRPARKKQIEALMELIAETEGADKAILKVWLKAILAGDFRYFKEFLDRMDGKIADKLITEGSTIIVDRKDRSKARRRSRNGSPRRPARPAGEGEG